ncbi:lytic transglycosylase [Amylibacter kogurei]|uniref:Lytic transglycosylase n=1 Tax=Paramylibacter kogurei TaxID=1889778 RepID=A0A2G5KAI2_9RHOB|nr:lytic transglycosylase domain-containing protein [Amylibacter kogurei]PIB26527.1 lytic transglycosylase [Amylibacter kogurei]
MQSFSRRTTLALCLAALASCGGSKPKARPPVVDNIPLYPNETPELRRLINKYAEIYDVPVALVHRVVKRESTHNPAAINRPYYGLMQILPATAKSMGYSGSPQGLLDAETNLKYSVKYLRGAWLLSDGSFDTAVKWYSRGYYYEAKRRGMLVETGLRSQ